MFVGWSLYIAKVDALMMTGTNTGRGHMQTILSTSLKESAKLEHNPGLPDWETMREEYHIKVNRSEREHVDRVLSHLGVKPTTIVSLNTDKGSTLDYIVDLSKYELLYVRLVINGTVVNITEWMRDNEKILHADTKV